MTEASLRFDDDPDARHNRLFRAVRAASSRLLEALGFTAEPVRMRWWSAFEITAAATLLTLGPLIVTGEQPDLQWLGIAAAAVAIAQFAQLTVRVGAGTVRVAWGDAAMIVVLYAVPLPWVPAVVGAGVLCSHVLRRLVAERQPALWIVRNSAMLGLAGVAAAYVTHQVAPVYRVELTSTTTLALCAGAAAYALSGMSLVAASIAWRREASYLTALASVGKTKSLMVVGNVLVGLFVTFCLSVEEPVWLLLLPPGLWLLQQTYIHRIRADDERRTWQEFAAATRALNQLDEASVVDACLNGARQLFAPDEVELTVIGSDGVSRRYAVDRHGETVVSHASRLPADTDGLEAVRTLMVGRVRVGELRLRFNHQTPMMARQQAAFSAFGDALAAALHDAATHRELQAVSARSAYEASHDPLTGLANRAAMLTRGDAALRLLDGDTPVALLLLDVDHFKDVNDTLGHAAGDELLRVAASRLAAVAQPGELVGRLGGDEFALLLT